MGGGGIKIQKHLFDGITMVNLQEIKSDRIKEKKGERKSRIWKKKSLIHWNTHSRNQFFLVQYNFRYNN